MIEHASVTDVAAALVRDEAVVAPEGTVYLDVRTVEEFDQGHVPGAFNVPFIQRDPSSGAPVPNADFGAVVMGVIPPQTTIYCGCATGVRSQHAGMLLHQLGYGRVINVIEGFDGHRDPAGRILAPGWKDAGHPVAVGSDDERSYDALQRRRGADV